MRDLDARPCKFLALCLLAGCGGARLTGASGTGGATGVAGTGGAASAGAADAATAGNDGGATADGALADGDAAPEVAPLATAALFADAPGGGAVRLVVAGANVYWTERATGKVKSLATDTPGGTPTVVAMDQELPGPIAVDDTYVYWANEGDKTIRKAPRAAGAASPVLTATDVVSGLLARAGTIYYGAGASTYEVVVAGAASTTLMTFPPCRTSRTGALALDADHLYQTDYNLQFLSREKLDGTQANDDRCAADPTTAPKVASPDTVTHSQGELFEGALAVVGGQLIWADGANLATKTVTGVGGSTLTSSVGGNPITGFAVDGASLYFAEGSPTPADGTGDAIEVATIDLTDAGGTSDAKLLVDGQRGASQLAVTATHLYWVTTTGNHCAIRRLAK